MTNQEKKQAAQNTQVQKERPSLLRFQNVVYSLIIAIGLGSLGYYFFAGRTQNSLEIKSLSEKTNAVVIDGVDQKKAIKSKAHMLAQPQPLISSSKALIEDSGDKSHVEVIEKKLAIQQKVHQVTPQETKAHLYQTKVNAFLLQNLYLKNILTRFKGGEEIKEDVDLLAAVLLHDEDPLLRTLLEGIKELPHPSLSVDEMIHLAKQGALKNANESAEEKNVWSKALHFAIRIEKKGKLHDNQLVGALKRRAWVEANALIGRYHLPVEKEEILRVALKAYQDRHVQLEHVKNDYEKWLQNQLQAIRKH